MKIPNYNKKSSSGSITIEAVITVPFFVCFILTIGFFIKVFYVEEIIQHALNESTKEIAKVSYIYKKSGIYDKQQNIENKINEKQGAVYFIENFGYEKLKNESEQIIVREFMKKYLQSSNKGILVETRLKKLNIVDGYNGLDFSQSKFLQQDENINCVVKYNFKLPLPIAFINYIQITQSANQRAFLDGDSIVNISNNKAKVIEVKEDVWQLSNFERGKKIGNNLGNNLGYNFFGIDKLNNNMITSIVSIDITKDTYKKPNNFYKILKNKVNQLDNFLQGEKQGIIVKKESYEKKCLQLVVPNEEFSVEQQIELNKIKVILKEKNIYFEIVIIKKKDN